MGKMKIVGKTLNEYFVALKNYLVVIIILGLVRMGELSFDYPPEIQTLGTILILIVIFLVGWSTVRKHGFNLKQVGIAGFVLSFGVHWTLPFFHIPLEIAYLFLINSILFVVISVLGGWVGEKFKK